MREIKFRAWYKITKEMEYLKDTSWPYWGDCILENSDADGKDTGNYKIMQYTGLKDKNGKEIYEGDIIQTSIGKITIDDIFCNFVIHTYVDIDRMNQPEKHIEVIGNIYEKEK